MSIKDTVVNGLEELKKPRNALLLGASKYAYDVFGKKNVAESTPPNDDAFSLSSFTAKLKTDQFRLSKGYYYIGYILVNGASLEEIMSMGFHLNKVTLPGWRIKSQQAKIYGLQYEIPIELEQDPMWMTFNVDIMHRLEKFFMHKTKVSLFDKSSYSPKYKEEAQFNMQLIVTDENFTPVHSYIFENCFIKTVLNVSYGASNVGHQEITVELVYETVKYEDILTARKSGNIAPDITSKNKLKIGPFNADISVINQAKDTISNIPKWFTGETKL